MKKTMFKTKHTDTLKPLFKSQFDYGHIFYYILYRPCRLKIANYLIRIDFGISHSIDNLWITRAKISIIVTMTS